VTPPTPDPRPPAPPEPILTADGTPDDLAFLFLYLQAHDAPCPVCGYNLHALTEPRCPECGHAVRLRVAAKVPHLRAWLTLATTTAASAGLGILFSMIHTSSRFARGPAFWAERYFYLSIPLLAAVLLARRPFTRRPPWLQWLVALPLAFLALASLVTAIVML
jgi:hypothetical protein